MSFLGEIKRRKVFQIAGVYLVVAWLIMQVVDVVNEPLRLPDWFETVAILLLAIGLPIALVVSWAYDITAEGVVRDTQNQGIGQSRGRAIEYVLIGLLIVAVGWLGYREISPSSGVSIAIDGILANSVAILPFENLSSDPDQDYFSDGISLELRDALQNVPDLYVAPRDLVLPLKGSTDSLLAIAGSLRVEHLLTGSVRKAGDTVRVTATLSRPLDGSQIWTNAYDGTLEQIFDFQSAIASAVVDSMAGTFDESDLELFPGGTDNDAAYDLYLRAQSESLPFFAPIGQGRDALYRQALALDPDFAQAQIALGSYLVSRSAFAIGLPEWEEIAGAADRAVRRAVELAPELPGTLLLVAERNMDTLQWVEAEAAFQMAMEISGGRDFEVNALYGNFLLRVGRLEDAVTYLERARLLAPLLARPVSHLTMALDALGSTARVNELQDGFWELVGSDNPVWISPEIFRQIYAGNIREANRLLELAQISNFSIFENLEDRDATLAELRAASEGPNAGSVNMQSWIAMLAANFDEADLAVSAWRRALRSQGYLIFTWTPLMTPVRTNPTFKDTLREFRLVEYWQEAEWPDQCMPIGDDDFVCS